MKFSNKAKEVLKSMEGLALYPYDDQVGLHKRIYSYVKGATIGYGHLISKSEWNKYNRVITLKEAEDLLEQELIPFEKGVLNLVKIPLKQNEFDALVFLAYNIGLENLRTSSVLKMVNGVPGSNYKTLESAWNAFNKSQGKVMGGLVKRRAMEYNIFKNNVYQLFK